MTHPDQPQHPGAPVPPAQPPHPGYPQPPVPPQPPQGFPQPPPGYSSQPSPAGYGQQPPAGYGQQPPTGYGQQPPKKSKTGLIVTIIITSVAVLAGAVLAVLTALGVFSGNNADPTIDVKPTSTASADAEPTDEPTEEPTPEPSEAPDIDDAELDLTPRNPDVPFPDKTVTWKPGSPESFAARDQFFIDQQFPMDGSLLTAVTIDQRTFIERQRTLFTGNGAELTPQIEAVYLAMTSDACETAILNAHSVDATTYDSFIATSPLFSEILSGLVGAEREAASRNLEEVMLFGMSYVCPGDVNEWSEIYELRYGVFPKIY